MGLILAGLFHAPRVLAAEVAGDRRNEPPPAPSLASTVAPDPPQGRKPNPDEETSPLPSMDTRWFVSFSPAFDLGSLPLTSPGLKLGIDVRRGVLVFHVVASGFLARSADASGPSVALFDTMTLTCALGPVSRRVELGACGGIGVGLLRATSADGRDSALRLRPEISALARIDVALSPLWVVTGDVGALLDPLRPSMMLAGMAEPYRPSLFAFRGSLGLALRFR